MQQESMNTILMFRTRERTLAVPIESVLEVLPAFEILRVPGMASVAAGMISLRGEVMPVVDSAVLVGAAPLELNPQQKFIVVICSLQPFAILVETVEDLIEIGNEQLINPSNGQNALPIAGIVAVEEEMVLVLDVEACGRMNDIFTEHELETSLCEAEGRTS